MTLREVGGVIGGMETGFLGSPRAHLYGGEMILQARSTHLHLDQPQFRATLSLAIITKYLCLSEACTHIPLAPKTFNPVILNLQQKVSHGPQPGPR